jgi:hypothetical protein
MTLITLLLQKGLRDRSFSSDCRPPDGVFSSQNPSFYLRKMYGMALRMSAMEVLPVQVNLSAR